MALRGKPYHLGGQAYLPLPKGGPAKVNHYGGWVCSPECDQRVFREMRAQNVWGSTEARLMANAYERHADAK